MNLPARMAWRYLFAAKSTNAINLITLIAGFGISIGAAALLLVLSVFNGFEEMFLGLFDNLNPDVRIEATKGKTFALSPELVAQLQEQPGVVKFAATLEETAMFSYAGRHQVGRIKGVDAAYPAINGIDSVVQDGQYLLEIDDSPLAGAVIGNQLSIALGIDPFNQYENLTVFMTRPRSRGGALGSALTGRSGMIRREFRPMGIIQSMEAFGTQAVLIPLSEARQLLSMEPDIVSAVEVKLDPAYINETTYDELRTLLGPDFTVKNRMEQESSILKIMQVEKWVGFALVCLMMILISFNLVGALWMIVLEKKRDISILRSLGMTSGDIRGVFLRVGLALCLTGITIGMGLATVLILVQEEFSLFRIAGPLSEPYPIALRWMDYPIVTLTVVGIGLAASILPARYAARIKAVITEE